MKSFIFTQSAVQRIQCLFFLCLFSTLSLSAQTPARITTQPTAQTVCAGSAATFSVVATGSSGYQWYKNGAPIGGAVNSSYTTPATTSTNNNDFYYVEVKSSLGPNGDINSNTVSLTVNSTRIIASAPFLNQNKCEGDNLTLSVTATGTPTPSIQWKKGTTNVVGANSLSLNFTNLTSADAGGYSVVATNSCGTDTYGTINVNVNLKPTISTQPIGATKLVGETFTTSVTATNAGSYQWLKSGNSISNGATGNGSSISGATSSSLAISTLCATCSGTYTVRVTGAGVCSSQNVTSTNAVLVVSCTPTTNPTAKLVWNGSVDTDWAKPCNWTPTSVPTAANDVEIPSASITNYPTIAAAAVAKTVWVKSSATLTIAATGSLTINGSGSYVPNFTISTTFVNNGTVTNNGQLTMGNTSAIGGLGLYSDGTFNNGSTGSINVDRVQRFGEAVSNFGTFSNLGNITLGAIETAGDNGLFNRGTFNNNGGTIKIDNFTRVGLYNYSGGGIFTNQAIIIIGAMSGSGLTGFQNDDTFNNNSCGQLIINRGRIYNNTSKTINNSGYVRVDNDLANDGTFTNNGVLKYKSKSGTDPINATASSVIVNNHPSATIFTYGATFNGTVDGIFKDANATNSAGTFTAPNTFVPSGLTAGVIDLYAKITPFGNTCGSYIVPFEYVVPQSISASITTVGTLNNFSTCSGTASASQSFTVSGESLTANITVAAPTGFEVSTSASSGFGGSLTLSPSVGTVSITTIYVRLSSTATGSPTGNITCTSTNATTRTIAVSGTVTIPPTANISYAGNPFCSSVSPVNVTLINTSGDAVTSTAAGLSIKIIPSNEFTSTPAGLSINATSGQITPSTSTAGIYTITYTIAASGSCSAVTATTSVTIKPTPNKPIITGKNEICFGENTVLSTTIIPSPGVATFLWSTMATTSSVNVAPTSTQVYTVTTTLDGCVSPTSDGYAVTVNPLPNIPTITANNMGICKGGNSILTGTCSSTTDIFRWSTPALLTAGATLPSSNTRVVTEPGTYKGLCESNKGCLSAEVSIIITQAQNCNGQNFITVTPVKPIICPNSSVTLTATGCSGTLTWTGGPSPQTGNSAVVSPAVTTTYLVQCSTGGGATVDVVVASTNVVVSNNVTTGTERVKATETIESDKKIGNPNFTPAPAVSYEAGKAIVLKPGFVAEKWSTFKAEIKGCN